MKRDLVTSVLALICTCLIGHAGTSATVTVTLQDGARNPAAALDSKAERGKKPKQESEGRSQ